MNKDILIVDDEEDIRNLIKGILEDEGYETRQAGNVVEALSAVEAKEPDLIILDIWLKESDKDGIEVLKSVKKDYPFLPVLMISGHGTIETAVSTIKFGAYDFIEKPFKSDRLLLMIERAIETASLKQENKLLKAQAVPQDITLIGESVAISTIRSQIEKVAPTNSRVLITGEAGTGKEIIARTIHASSERKGQSFVALNCAVLHPDRIEEELFGSELNDEVRKGVLERADKGTLLLDEVADMPLETQGKILRVLQDRQVKRVGGQRPINVDVRILASTNKDLVQAIETGDFREDLYYRLNVVTLSIPALSTRKDDIIPLAEYFMSKQAKRPENESFQFTEEAKILLKRYNWPGNVRQLRNVVEWINIMGNIDQESNEIGINALPPEVTGKGDAENADSLNEGVEDYITLSLRDARETFEREYLKMQLERFQGNISQTAKFVGMERSALHRKLKSLEILVVDKQDSGEEKNQSPNTSLGKSPRKSA